MSFDALDKPKQGLKIQAAWVSSDQAQALINPPDCE